MKVVRKNLVLKTKRRTNMIRYLKILQNIRLHQNKRRAVKRMKGSRFLEYLILYFSEFLDQKFGKILESLN